jgi:hypothetical protein
MSALPHITTGLATSSDVVMCQHLGWRRTMAVVASEFGSKMNEAAN